MSNSFDEKIRAAIKVECDRAGVGEDRQAMLYNTYIVLGRDHDYRQLDDTFLIFLAYSIDIQNGRQFRTMPVILDGEDRGVTPEYIPETIDAWNKRFNSEIFWETVELRFNADSIIKEFLDIHPFSYGNGRIAWLLRVWLLDQWDDPQPLPNYYA